MSERRTPRDKKPSSGSHGAVVVLTLPPLPDRSFVINATVSRGQAEVEMSGNIDVKNVREVGTTMVALMNELEKRGIHEVRVDLKHLYFLNSSGLKLFVTWITRVGEMLPAKRYQIVLVANSNLQWQKRSLGALQALDPSLVHLVEGEPT
jgi:anti-anti-sigma factor